MNKKKLIIVGILTILIAFMDITGIPSAFFIRINILDIQPMYFTLMVNFIIIGIIAYIVLKYLCPNWELGLKKDGFVNGFKKYGLAGIIVAIIGFIAFYVGLKPFDLKPSIFKVLIEGIIYYIGVAINGLILTMGVQLSPMFAFLVTKKKTKDNINFKLKIDKWFILSILMPILILSITALILSFIGIKYQSTGYIGITLIIAILTTIIGSVGEEIGWRGYLQNEVKKTCSLFVSSAVTGLMWGAWHFFKIMNNGIISYLLFIPTIFLFGIIMGYIYNKSNKSLVNMILFHSFVNLSTILMLFNRECNTFYITLTIINLIVIFILWINDREYFKLKRELVA